LNIFDLSKCAQTSKQLMNICEDKKFQQYCELKKIFKNSTLKLSTNDVIMVDITNQEAVKRIKEAKQHNAYKIELILEQEGKFENGSSLYTAQLYGVRKIRWVFSINEASFIPLCTFIR
jgi:molybdenum cofactor biosynthesis enzyme